MHDFIPTMANVLYNQIALANINILYLIKQYDIKTEVYLIRFLA